jgi:hypothetical protein
MAKLKTLKEASKATGVGLSTIRKYINEFAGLVPVEKGPRNALMFDPNSIKALKIIREGYQAKRSHEVIVEKLQAAGSKTIVAKKAPAAGLATQETILKGYEDQQTDQGFW